MPDTTPPPDASDDLTLVDARGLNCPMPVIELAKAMRDLDVGARVHLLSTDSTSKVDVPVWCRMQRQRLVSMAEVDFGTGEEFTFVVEKATAV